MWPGRTRRTEPRPRLARGAALASALRGGGDAAGGRCRRAGGGCRRAGGGLGMRGPKPGPEGAWRQGGSRGFTGQSRGCTRGVTRVHGGPVTRGVRWR